MQYEFQDVTVKEGYLIATSPLLFCFNLSFKNIAKINKKASEFNFNLILMVKIGYNIDFER